MKYLSNILIVILFITFSCQVNSSKKSNSSIINKNIESNKTASTCSKSDSLLFEKIINLSQQRNWQNETISQIIIKVGSEFIGFPYIASTLDTNNSEEKLVMNLGKVDCTTFVEYVSAISICIKQNKTTLSDFQSQLIYLRYRSGSIDGYGSRLHYFTDWLLENQKKGMIDIVSNKIGTIPYEKKINFMSTHPQFYKQLSDTTILNKIKASEINLSNQKLKLISKSDINTVESQIQDGDIIAFATSIEGLDVTHVAFAVRKNGLLCILHASLNAKKVVFSSISLTEYLSNQPKTIGIFVGRIKNTATQ